MSLLPVRPAVPGGLVAAEQEVREREILRKLVRGVGGCKVRGTRMSAEQGLEEEEVRRPLDALILRGGGGGGGGK